MLMMQAVNLTRLPPGFRFHPTDEEIIINYLYHKVMDKYFVTEVMNDVNLNKCDPWNLPQKAMTGEGEWFFFFKKDRKYAKSLRTNRASESGYWKATGKDKEILRKGTKALLGMKKTLVFYKGKAPAGERTDWVIHEYRLEGNLKYVSFHATPMEEWVVCRVFHKKTNIEVSNLGFESSPVNAEVDKILNTEPELLPTLLLKNSCSIESPNFGTDQQVPDQKIEWISDSPIIYDQYYLLDDNSNNSASYSQVVHEQINSGILEMETVLFNNNSGMTSEAITESKEPPHPDLLKVVNPDLYLDSFWRNSNAYI